MNKPKKKQNKKEREQNRPFVEVWKENEAEKERLAQEAKAKKEAEEKEKAEQYAKEHPSTEELLKDIRDLLAVKQNEKEVKEIEEVDA